MYDGFSQGSCGFVEGMSGGGEGMLDGLVGRVITIFPPSDVCIT